MVRFAGHGGAMPGRGHGGEVSCFMPTEEKCGAVHTFSPLRRPNRPAGLERSLEGVGAWMALGGVRPGWMGSALLTCTAAKPEGCFWPIRRAGGRFPSGAGEGVHFALWFLCVFLLWIQNQGADFLEY